MRASEAKRLLSRIETKAGYGCAAQVKQLIDTAERVGELESQIATLTAELEKARSGEACEGNEIWNDCRLPTAPLPPAEPTPEEAGEELSNETCERILEMVLDKRFDDAYMLPLGSRITIGKRAWTLRERDAGHPDYMHFDETTVGESYPQKRIMYPSEVQWCLDNGCKVVLPEPAPAKPEWQEALVAWAREVAYQIATVRPTSEVEPLMVLSRELSAALEQE